MDLRLFIAALFCVSALASQVTQVHPSLPIVAISQETEMPFEKDDRVCIVQDKMDIACGDVAELQEKGGAVVKLDFQKENVSKKKRNSKVERVVELEFDYPVPKVGDTVRLVAKNSKETIRQLTSDLLASNRFAGEVISESREDELQEAIRRMEASRPFKPVSVLSLGMTWLYPTLQYQQALSPNWGIGMMALYLNHNVGEKGNMKGPGAFFSYNHYYNGALNGVWWQLAAGSYKVDVDSGTKAGESYQPAIMATLGWRSFWKDSMNFGVGVGGQYLPFGNNAAKTGLTFSGFIPSVAMDVGLAF